MAKKLDVLDPGPQTRQHKHLPLDAMTRGQLRRFLSDVHLQIHISCSDLLDLFCSHSSSSTGLSFTLVCVYVLSISHSLLGLTSLIEVAYHIH